MMQPLPTTFLHVDMDAFFASVEQRDHPELRGKPVVVGAPPGQRGVVAAASYEARKYGIHSAMPSSTAQQKCPHAVFVAHNMARYKEASRQIMRIFESYTPLVQPLSIDEAFLDVTGARRLFGTGQAIAEKIRRDILEQTELTASVGVAPNMFLAKIASDMNKPDSLTMVPFEQKAIEQFLAPLPIGRMWGVGKVTQKKLLSLGLSTIGQLQQCDFPTLERAVGPRAARGFSQLAHGIDERSIETDSEEKSISNETTFAEDLTDREQIEAVYKRLIDKVGARLRKAGYFASTVHLKIRWSDFSTITRQTRFSIPCADDVSLREAGMALLEEHLRRRPVRLIGFGVSGLSETDQPPAQQLNLFEAPDTAEHEKRNRLSRAADGIKEKYGGQSLRRGSDLN
ncbi:DNA polymerase IV [Pontiella sulfatireligans]|uniref:DNA polymerase IV n=1 Tax=Pontiella sulfatireligans TaxID=2750658 RepID=A0A6C2UVA2_9BACT|nr:DNA polymerase IV [Pontiella sulfatireligans]VGO22776.1 DNA polymerase IV [Pontiella sulfatireligans]